MAAKSSHGPLNEDIASLSVEGPANLKDGKIVGLFAGWKGGYS